MRQLIGTVSLLVLLQGLPAIFRMEDAIAQRGFSPIAQSPTPSDSSLPADPIERVLAAKLHHNIMLDCRLSN